MILIKHERINPQGIQSPLGNDKVKSMRRKNEKSLLVPLTQIISGTLNK